VAAHLLDGTKPEAWKTPKLSQSWSSGHSSAFLFGKGQTLGKRVAQTSGVVVCGSCREKTQILATGSALGYGSVNLSKNRRPQRRRSALRGLFGSERSE